MEPGETGPARPRPGPPSLCPAPTQVPDIAVRVTTRRPRRFTAVSPRDPATRCRDPPCSSVEQGPGGRCHPPGRSQRPLGHGLVGRGRRCPRSRSTRNRARGAASVSPGVSPPASTRQDPRRGVQAVPPLQGAIHPRARTRRRRHPRRDGRDPLHRGRRGLRATCATAASAPSPSVSPWTRTISRSSPRTSPWPRRLSCHRMLARVRGRPTYANVIASLALLAVATQTMQPTRASLWLRAPVGSALDQRGTSASSATAPSG